MTPVSIQCIPARPGSRGQSTEQASSLVPQAHRIDPGDDVAIALRDLAAGESVEVGGIAVVLRDPPEGTQVRAARPAHGTLRMTPISFQSGASLDTGGKGA
jgi:hypothetical protein